MIDSNKLLRMFSGSQAQASFASSHLLWFLGMILFMSLLNACSNKDQEDNFALEREIPGLRIEFDDQAGEPQYFVSWDEPVAMLTEPENFKSYYLWIVLDADKQEAFLERETPSSSDLTTYDEDSWSAGILLFKPTIQDGELPRFEITPELIAKAQDQGSTSVTILVWADFGNDFRAARTPTKLYLKDVFPADQVAIEVKTGPRFAKFIWQRPEDLVSRIPNREDGRIFGYNLVFKFLDNKSSKYDFDNVIWVRDSSSAQLDSQHVKMEKMILTKSDGMPLVANSETIVTKKNSGDNQGTLHFAILDSMTSGSGLDTFELYLDGLTPQRTYELSIIALDSLGNTLDLESNSFVSPLVLEFSTTDTTQPQFNRDSIVSQVPAGSPSKRVIYWSKAQDDQTAIAYYEILQIDSSYQGFDTTLTQLENPELIYANIDGTSEKNWLLDTLEYFIPGRTIHVQIQAFDATGYGSPIISMSEAVAPLNPDLCPELNMVPLLDSLGQTYCIDQVERRAGQNTASPGAFKVDLTAQEASDFCQAKGDISNASGTWSFDLCTDVQWQSACRGGDSTRLYGIVQYESSQFTEGLLYTDCNHGTNDSLVAHHSQIQNRSTRCVTEAGVYDLAGHYQEWVQITAPGIAEPFGLKGGSYAKGENSSTLTLNRMAQCNANNLPVRTVPVFVDINTALVRLNDGRILLGTDSILTDSIVRLSINDTLGVESYNDQVLLYEVSDASGVLVKDFPVDYNEYRRDSMQFAKVYFNGLDAKITARLNEVYILETENQSAISFHKNPSISFRCCAVKN